MSEADQFLLYLVSVLKLTLEMIILIGVFCFLAYINVYFALLVLIVLLFFSSLYLFLLKDKLSIWGRQRQSNIQKLIQFMQEGFGGIKIIKLLGRENFFFNKYKFHNLNLSKISINTFFFQGVPRLLFELIGIVLITFSLFFLYYSGKTLIEITQILSIYIAAIFRILPSVSKMTTSLQQIKYHHPVINVLYNDLKSFKKKSQLSNEKFSFNKNIFVDIKKFQYPNSKNFEISNVKLDISKGQKIGIIGPTASGKSTIVEIVTGILEPTKGSIIVDEESIFSNRNGWQKLIGFVPQKIFILDESLRNNILFGLDNKKYNDDKVISVIKKLSLESLLKRLPDGLDGNLGEDGINLSGGEIQRIGLCRTLIYDPEVLFLDEATSSLDSESELLVQQALESLMAGRTCIVIAHRLSTIKSADQILVLEGGEVIERGTHTKLLKEKGRYTQLYEKQYGLERNRFINPGEDFTPDPKQAVESA